MNIEQERAEFEAWWDSQHVVSARMTNKQLLEQRLMSEGWVEYVWNAAYKAGRADLQSQDREDAERWKFIQRKWEDMKASDCSAALYCLGISREGVDVVEQSVAEIIDHARRVEGEASATK